MSGKNENARLFGTDRILPPGWPRALAASVVILFVGLVWALMRQIPSEPMYRGKALTLWLRTYAPSSSSGLHSQEWNEADDAVRHLGTNCIPTLLHMIRGKDSKLKLRLVALARKQRLIRIHFVSAAQRNVEASRAFIALGDMARDAVPALVQMYHDDITADSQSAIEDALAWIGPAAKPAIPLLLGAATNSNPRVRANALWALGEIHSEPPLCVPELIHALGDSDDWARLSAAHALGMFGTNAKSAVPSLTELTNTRWLFDGMASMRVQVMLEAKKALNKIDPHTVSPTSEAFPDFGIPAADSPLSTKE